jgi:hypothetical protein
VSGHRTASLLLLVTPWLTLGWLSMAASMALPGIALASLPLP